MRPMKIENHELFLYVYFEMCDGSYYAGHTDNFEKRIAEHTSGSIPGYTQTRLPVELVYIQEFSSRDEAFNSRTSNKKVES